MGTQSSTLRPPPDPARTALVDPKTGMLTRDGFWFLYLQFRAVQAAEGTAILEAVDSGTELALSPELRDLFKQQVSFLEAPPVITRADLEEVFKAVELTQSHGITEAQLEEVAQLGIVGDLASLLPRILDLERLMVLINDTSQFAGGGGTVLVGTHADRLAIDASTVGIGTVFFETDRTVFYIAVDAGSGLHKWVYASGVFSSTLSGIPTLGANDVNFLFGATDYLHLWRWTGAAWHFAPGDPGSGFIVAGSPVGGAWAACTGGSVTIATDAGGTTSVTTPNLTGEVFIKGGSPAGQQVATRPTWETASATEDDTHDHTYGGTTDPVGDHSHALNTFTNIWSLQTGATLFAETGVVSPTQDAGAHSHTYSGTTNNDTHNHTLTDANARLKVPSEANGGLPLRISLTWYIRL